MNILVFAPHNDDEVLGVGGTIKRLVNDGNDVFVCEVTSGINYKTLQQEACEAHSILGVKDNVFLNLPVGQLRNMKQNELNSKVSEVINRFQPSIVFIPFIGDMHIDHREVSESVMVAVRPFSSPCVRKVYMYETLSETGWNIPSYERSFIPNVWVDITGTIDDKICAMNCYKSQLLEYPHPRSKESILDLAKYRGATVGANFAESFMLVRQIV